jgi:hypothetical protein
MHGLLAMWSEARWDEKEETQVYVFFLAERSEYTRTYILANTFSIVQMDFLDSLRKELKRYRDQAAQEVVSIIFFIFSFVFEICGKKKKRRLR